MSEIHVALAQLAHDYSQGTARYQYVPHDLRPMDEWDRAAAQQTVEGICDDA